MCAYRKKFSALTNIILYISLPLSLPFSLSHSLYLLLFLSYVIVFFFGAIPCFSLGVLIPVHPPPHTLMKLIVARGCINVIFVANYSLIWFAYSYRDTKKVPLFLLWNYPFSVVTNNISIEILMFFNKEKIIPTVGRYY